MKHISLITARTHLSKLKKNVYLKSNTIQL